MNSTSIKILCLVTACGWDRWGNPIEVKLSTESERDYWVVENELSKDLIKYLQSWVEVHGNLIGSEQLEVTSISSIKENITGGFS